MPALKCSDKACKCRSHIAAVAQASIASSLRVFVYLEPCRARAEPAMSPGCQFGSSHKLHIPTRMHVFDDAQFQTLASIEFILCNSVLCSSCTTLILDGKSEGWQQCVMACWGLMQRWSMTEYFMMQRWCMTEYLMTGHLVLFILQAQARYALVRPSGAH